MAHPTRRTVLLAGGTLGLLHALAPVFAPPAAAASRTAGPGLVPAADALALRYTAPGRVERIMEEGLPIGNGRLGALTTGDPARDVLHVTDASVWTAGEPVVGDDGQLAYDGVFGTWGQLARLVLEVPAHAGASGYGRRLDLSNGLVTTTYVVDGVTYHRELYASHPDNVVVVRLTQAGGGSHTGSVTLQATRGEPVTTDAATTSASLGGTLAGSGLRYGAVVTASSATGTVAVDGATVRFTGCAEVLIVFCGGTNYLPDATRSFRDDGLDPVALARATARAAAGQPGDALRDTHVADYRRLFDRTAVDLGRSTDAQRALPTPERLAARAVPGAAADPELEASYLQFGRYLTITGSRDGLPTNLQGLWVDRNDPEWHGDYHTNINLQMNYWLPDRAGLSECFGALADYCLAQLPAWTDLTRRFFDEPRSPFRNSSGRVAGWTVATSADITGGLGWRWHPPGNAWLCNSLYEHFEYTQDTAYLARIMPLLRGACEFWEARLIPVTVTGADGRAREVLVGDGDWSPEHGPLGQRGITYAQELVWQLFENFRLATDRLGTDAAYAATITGLQARLYLPEVSATTGWLQEWMTDANLGETTHRHLSGLVGFHPGDRITADGGPADILAGVRNQLVARGMRSTGWACAWRAMCWARLGDADRAYRLVLTVMRPTVNFDHGSAINLFDMYSHGGGRSTFQIDANFGAAAAMVDMLVYSRTGVVDLLPALPAAWHTGSARGLGVRGGFVLDLAWRDGQVTTATLRSVGGTSTQVRFGAWRQDVEPGAGGSVTLTPPPRQPPPTRTFVLVNRRSGNALDVPGSAREPGTALVEHPRHGGPNQQWRFDDVAGGAVTLTAVHSGLLADVSGGSVADDAPVIQWTDTGGTNQHWRVVDAGDGHVKLVNVRSGKVLGVRDTGAVVQQPDTGAPTQHWLRAAARAL